MTSRFVLILLAMMWSAYAAAAEVVNEPEQNNQWLTPSAVISADDQQNQETNKQSTGNAKKEQTPKSERSRLGGMFDLLLPSGLRDNQ